GQVGTDLLEPDPASPFGVRVSLPAYASAFDKVWKQRSVVLVEASDLVRLVAYTDVLDDTAAATMRQRVLRHIDHMIGQLLQHVDPRHDAVMVVGPVATERQLTIAALRAPGVTPGFLRSATTQRSGFVQLI